MSVNSGEYGSDDEVYAMADAIDAADPRQEELVKETKAIEPLPPVDHKNIEYDEFAKDFYEESAETAAMSPAEVRLTLHLTPAVGFVVCIVANLLSRLLT